MNQIRASGDEFHAYWARSVERLLLDLKSPAQGLPAGQAAQRLVTSGPNTLETQQAVTPLGVFVAQFKSTILLILLGATLVSAALGDWLDALIILLIVMGSAGLSFRQEYSAGVAAETLRREVSLKAKVLRDGRWQDEVVERLVPGDRVGLSAGSIIPADGVLLEAQDLFVNQATLTGETFPVEKQVGQAAPDAPLAERTNCVFMGTSVQSGRGQMLIVSTGTHTALGQIAKRLTSAGAETEFERGIRHLGYLLSEIMFVMVLGIFFFNVLLQKPVLDSLLFSIALAVGLTPQLLPAVISINLSRGAQAMAKEGVIVRRLAALENFGSMDTMCTDKTGTLTAGVVKLDQAVDIDGQPSALVLRAAAINAQLQTGLDNPLDAAIAQAETAALTGVVKIHEIPYDFSRKRLSVIVEQAGLFDPDPGRMLITKGALANVLTACSAVFSGGQPQPVDENRRAELQDRFAKWSGQGYRVLGVAVRAIDTRPHYAKEDEQSLTFLGFLLFFDPPKSDAAVTIKRLNALGVELKVITGDNALVARHAAEALGLEPVTVLTGAEISTLSSDALQHRAQATTLFAEVDPDQKERVIHALRQAGRVVGYMGDGINDAPALRAADIGVSVDNAVDVAKQAADFILLQHDLSVLERGIRLGRATFANTLKYMFMATSANFGNMFSMAGASLILPFLPMLTKQILLINLLTDLPEMTISTDRVDQAFIDRPHRWDIGFIRRFMFIFGPLSSVFDFATFAILLWGVRASESVFHTAWFVESVLSAIAVVFALRTRLSFFQSRPSRALVLVSAAVVALVLALPYVPLGPVFGFTPLPVEYLLIIFGIVGLYFVCAEAAKRMFYRNASPVLDKPSRSVLKI